MKNTMSERHEALETFLKAAGWQMAQRFALPGDASSRRYVRLEKDGQKAILMDQPQSAETPAAPPGASVVARRKLGYNALARLAGADCGRFVAVATYLRACGLSAPAIFHADTASGFVLLEDLGNDLFADVVAADPAGSRGDECALYRAAAETLAHLHCQPAPARLPGDFPFHAYDEAALLAEIDLMTEWFFPHALGRAATVDEVAEHRVLWQEVLEGSAASVFVHRDFHAQNLIWLPDREGVARVGLIDFQDAVGGSRAYDLISLIEDARRDVSPETAADTTARYLAAMRERGIRLDADAFSGEMARFAAQRNIKIVGIFARLYKRDGKAQYLRYLPRVWSYLRRDLEHPSMTALKTWYARKIPPQATL